MSDLFWLTDKQMERLRPFFPRFHGVPRVDDRRVLSGIIFVNRNGLRWCDAPAAYGPPKALYNRWVRWSRMGVFARMLIELAARNQQTDTVMIDATHLKVHRTAASMRAPVGALLLGGDASLAHQRRAELEVAHCGRCQGRPIRMFLSAGHRSDYLGAAALVSSLSKIRTLVADRGYDAD